MRSLNQPQAGLLEPLEVPAWASVVTAVVGLEFSKLFPRRAEELTTGGLSQVLITLFDFSLGLVGFPPHQPPPNTGPEIRDPISEGPM